MKTPESYEKAEIKKYLDQGEPLLWYMNPFMAGYGKSGIPDIVGVYRCKGFFSIEVKREGKEPTTIQWHRMEAIKSAGGKTFWGTAAKVISEFEMWIDDD